MGRVSVPDWKVVASVEVEPTMLSAQKIPTRQVSAVVEPTMMLWVKQVLLGWVSGEIEPTRFVSTRTQRNAC